MKITASVLFSLLLIGCIGLAEAQVPYFQHYSLLKKNEFVQVNAIFQDSEGFIWYGTNKGLFIFDGLSLHQFTVADGLPNEQVTAIAEDALGVIWIGHRNGMLAYIKEGGKAVAFHPSEGDANQEISDILFDRKGNMWFSTLNDGLYYFLFDSKRLYRLDEHEGMPDLFVYDIAEDAKGNVWAGTDGGLAICTLDSTKVTIKIQNYKTGLPDNIIKKIVIDDDGSAWLATEDVGIIRFDPNSAVYSPMMEGSWKYGVVSDFVMHENKIWIACGATGILVFDRKSKQIKVYSTKENPGFSSTQVLMNDAEGNIWVGSKEDVMRTRGDHVEFIDAFEPSIDVNIVAVTVDKQGNQWFAASDGLFKRAIDQLGRASIVRPLKGTAFEKYTVISLYTDSEGYVWAGLYGEGVLRINPSNGSIRFINQELSNGNVLNITGKRNELWLATLVGATRIRTQGDKLDIKNFTSEDGLISDYVYQIFIDSKDRIWFATDGKGVDMMDEKGFHHFQKGLNSKVVYGFAEDHHHTLWINVQGDGLYSMVNDEFKPFNVSGRQLRDNNIAVLTTTTSGNLFIMHDLGIDVYDVKNNKIFSHGDDVGLRDRRANLNAFSNSGVADIYIGTDNGIVKFSDFEEEVEATPRPLIEEVDVMNNSIDFETKDIVLEYNQNDVTIHYLGIWYQDPSSLHYLYRLDDYEKEWISSNDHSVTYSNLPPGEYTFMIRASDREDFNDAKMTSLRIVINPPFWKTTWFFALSILVGLIVFYWVIKYRERRLRNDKLLLEESVKERTLEIIKKNEEIHAQAEEIQAINENLEELVRERTSELLRKNKALEEYAFINAHELRAPVASILGLIHLMETLPKEELDHELYLKHLQDSAQRLDDVVRSIGKAIERGDSPENK